MKKKFFIVAAILSSSQLFSQQPDSLVTDHSQLYWSNVELDGILLTATKYPRKQSETGKVVTVITKPELERNSGKTLNEVLNNIAGSTIIGANNNLGTNQTVSIRGSSAGNVLILIDGIPVNDPSVITNYFDLNFIDINQVERVEILKGGQSTLYGSDAVAGVINIILKKPSLKKCALSGSLTGGSYGTFKQNVGLSGSNQKLGYSLNYTHLSSKGFSSAYDPVGDKGFDKDGYNQHAVNGKLNIPVSKKVQAYISGSYSYYKADIDGFAFKDEKDYTVTNNNGQAGTGFLFNHNKGTLHLNYNFNYVSRVYIDDSVSKGSPYVDYSDTRFIGRTHFAELYNNWKWSNVELLAGMDYRFNNTNQYSLYVYPGYTPPASVLKAKMSQVSPYASVIFKNDKGFNAELGGRVNIHSAYGTNLSFTFNPSYMIQDKAKVFVNLYSAFKTPTLYQLFDPSAGNINLEPEKGIITEAGVDLYRKRSSLLRVVGFYRNTKNAIQYIILDPMTYQSQYRNVSRQENYGVEVEANYKISKWSFVLNYTYTDGKTESPYDGTGASLGKDTTYYNLYRIPKNVLNFTIGCSVVKNLFISAHFKAVGSREEFIYGLAPTKLSRYETIGLYTEYSFSKKIKTFVDLKNITNEKYFDIPGYNSRMFNFMAGLNFNL